MSNISFSDQNHIEQLRKRLWCGRELGQVSVMIGAGFSCNATKIAENVPDFPLWNQLASQLYNEVYPGDSSSSGRANAIANPLKLAAAYEELFGRQLLNTFLTQIIPDRRYTPGRLHQLMLSLPWSDVFTTNYDTLLERTTPFIHDRKYDVIETISNIPGRMKPRIVKLHGSFPSHEPFIFTEEDYRTYPVAFAPFVNMVQQAIMETTLCLIGFSGDDPNFRRWIGWVRDNLGASAPSIYLCGVLDLPNIERQALLRDKIIPIDLAPLFPKAEYPHTKTRHANAIEWFLLNLMQGEPLNLTSWPEPPVLSTSIDWKPTPNLPSIRSISHPILNLEPYEPPNRENLQTSLNSDELQKLQQNWKEYRQLYPGWVVCPKQSRDSIWQHMVQLIEPIFAAIDSLSPQQAILLLNELNWRFEISLIPLYRHWADQIEKILSCINPFPQFVFLQTAQISPDAVAYQLLNWSEIQTAWVNLAFAIVREARDDQDKARFTRWIQYLSPIVYQNEAWRSRWFYEQCLFFLARLDREKVLDLLQQWQVSPTLDFWNVKRAAILVEIGNFAEAKTISEQALSNIRSRQQPYTIDYLLLSQESWTMILLEVIEHREWYNPNAEVIKERHRLRRSKLGEYNCDGWLEFSFLSNAIVQMEQKSSSAKEIGSDFDSGAFTVTYRFGAQKYSLPRLRPAFELLRLFEEGAIPVRCGLSSVFPESVVQAARLIMPIAPLWSLSFIIRTFKQNEIEKTFDSALIARLDQEYVDHLGTVLASALMELLPLFQSRQRGDDRSSLLHRFSLLLEILSRLCSRFSPKQVEDTLELAFTAAKYLPDQHLAKLHPLMRRTLAAMDSSQICSRMPDLLLFDLPVTGGICDTDRCRIESFEQINWEKDIGLDPDLDRSSWSLPIAALIEMVRTSSSQVRETAIYRLSGLGKINGLTVLQQQALADALWSRTDSTGLPADIGYFLYKSIILRLPEPNPGQAREFFRRYLLEQEFPVFWIPAVGGGITFNDRTAHYFTEWSQASLPLCDRHLASTETRCIWTSSEIVELLRKLINAWEQQKSEISRIPIDHAIFGDHVQSYFNGLKQLLISVIFPHLNEIEDELKEAIKQFLAELEEIGISTLSVLPATLVIFPDHADQTSIRLRKALNSLSQQRIQEACQGILHWFLYTRLEGQAIALPSPEFLSNLVDQLVLRRQPGLRSVMDVISVLLQYVPEQFTNQHREKLCDALENLIAETQLLEEQVEQNSEDTEQAFSFPTRPAYRKLAARIAYRLYQHFEQLSDAPMPQVLERWKNSCLNEVLPEIRKIWQ